MENRIFPRSYEDFVLPISFALYVMPTSFTHCHLGLHITSCPQVLPTSVAHKCCPQVLPISVAHKPITPPLSCPLLMPFTHALHSCPLPPPSFPPLLPFTHALPSCPTLKPHPPLALALHSHAIIPLIHLLTFWHDNPYGMDGCHMHGSLLSKHFNMAWQYFMQA